MNEIDTKILLICQSKRKLSKIKKIISKIRYNIDVKAWEVPSTSKVEKYYVDRFPAKEITDQEGNKHFIAESFSCTCNAILFKKYVEGMKKKEKPFECIHILALKSFLYLKVV